MPPKKFKNARKKKEAERERSRVRMEQETPEDKSQRLHYKTRIGRSTSPAGNECLDPYFRLSCIIPCFGKSREAACFGITCQAVINLTLS